ncbi:MAG: CPBP family intramembrane glutamic endopeptidase [Planctomycetaceae bacterium]
MPHDGNDCGRLATLGAVLFALAFPALVTFVYFVWLDEASSGFQQAAFAIGKTIQFGFPLLFVRLCDRRWFTLRRPTLNELALGFGAGGAIVLATAIVYLLWLKAALPASAVAAIRGKLEGFGVQSVPPFVLLSLFYSLVHSFLEEYYWRWFVFGRMRRLAPWPTAVIVSALGFTVHHVLVLAHYFGWRGLLTYLLSFAVTFGGALWAWMYQRTGALWAPWVSHLLVDAGIFCVGYDLAFR